jgi:hypothetical protein
MTKKLFGVPASLGESDAAIGKLLWSLLHPLPRMSAAHSGTTCTYSFTKARI